MFFFEFSESNDRHEFAKRTALPYHDARSIWFAFYTPYVDWSGVVEPIANFIMVAGEKGLFEK